MKGSFHVRFLEGKAPVRGQVKYDCGGKAAAIVLHFFSRKAKSHPE